MTHVSQSKLTVTVPETLAHGVYALEVTDPWLSNKHRGTADGATSAEGRTA